MRVRVILNPSAGRQFAQKNIELIIQGLLQDGTISQADLIETRGQGDAYRAARYFSPFQVDLVLAVGGDGTMHEVVNGLVDGHHQTPLAIYPAGTINDFARSLQISREVEDFKKMIRQFKVRPVDVGKAGDTYFFNVLAAGMMTDIAYKTTLESKTVLGQLAYYITATLDLPNQLERSISAVFESEECSFQGEILMFLVSNTSSVGGFQCMAPQASFDDGLLDVIIIHKQNLLELLPLVVTLGNGEHVKSEGITYFQTKSVKVSSTGPEPVKLDLDGEQVGQLPVEISVVEDAIRMLIP